jgi:hypothetical protein
MVPETLVANVPDPAVYVVTIVELENSPIATALLTNAPEF